MKEKGISLISLIVTIIVIILISSITIYTGGNMLDQSRVKSATDRMIAVATAIASHEEELGFSDIVVGTPSGDYRLLGIDDYTIMGLTDYQTNEMTPIYVYKNIDDTDKTRKEYKLKTPKTVKINSAYTDEDYVHYSYVFFDTTKRENKKVEFDTKKGVNRPLLTEDMMAVRTYFNDENALYTEPVEDVYADDWYDYSTVSPNWANVKMNNNIYYVWIPRFAYKIDGFYADTDLSNIPASAIKVIFLKEDTDYMANDEPLYNGYQVHPAFKYKTSEGEIINLPGFWVAKYNVNNAVDVLYKQAGEGTVVLGALEEVELTKLHGTAETVVNQLESHLIKNTEWAAVAYLGFATSGKSEDGSSMENNPSSVMDLNVRQFVAGALDNVMPSSKEKNFNIYTLDDSGNMIYESLEDNHFGDAIEITSAGNSENSSWFGGKSDKITLAEPFIIRGVDNCIFSYSADTRAPERATGCRNVLVVNI